ncbi:MAG: PLP-dependent transferase [Elusimicrobiaceae bacterium]|nr:PLP-dependent transferase [Elusimicrobiaceae bacterium]
MKFETLAIHAGLQADPATGAVSVAVYQISTFKHDTLTTNRGWSYSRTGNPTRAALENSVAALEGGNSGLAFSAGLAAETTVLSILNPGDEALADLVQALPR